MTDWYIAIAVAVAFSIILAALVALSFESRFAGAVTFIICVVGSWLILTWWWENVYEDALLRDKVDITDLREELNSEDVVFYDASSGPVPII